MLHSVMHLHAKGHHIAKVPWHTASDVLDGGIPHMPVLEVPWDILHPRDNYLDSILVVSVPDLRHAVQSKLPCRWWPNMIGMVSSCEEKLLNSEYCCHFNYH